MNNRTEAVKEHLLAAIDLLREEITHAPDTTTAARAADYFSDIAFTLRRIEDFE